MTETAENNKTEIRKTQQDFDAFSARAESEFGDQKQFNERLVYELRRLNDKLENEVQRLKDKLENAQQREASEREKLLLQLENQILKASRQLPPAAKNKDEDKDGE